MFESVKIKRILSRFSTADESDKPELINRLATYGGQAVPYLAEEVMSNRMLLSTAFEILEKLFKPEYLEIFVNGLDNANENVRTMYKESILNYGKKGIINSVVDYLGSSNHRIRKSIEEMIEEVGSPVSLVPKVIPFISHKNRDVKKSAMDILCNLESEESIAAIVPLLDDDDTWIQRKAIMAICKFNSRSTLPQLRDALAHDKDSAVQKAVIQAMGEIGGTDEARLLLPYIGNRDIILQQLAVDSIVKIANASIIPELLEYLGDKDANVRRAAVYILNGLNDPDTASVLIKALKDGDWWVREIATDALSELGGSKISSMIIKLLEAKDVGIRRSAVEFYCKVKDANAYKMLANLLNDDDWWVREKAITALGLIGDPRAIPAITRMIPDYEVVWAIPKALSRIGGSEALKPLAQLMNDPRKQVRSEVAKALHDIGGKQTVPYFKLMVKDEDIEIKNFALKQLNELTGKTWHETEVLKELKEAEKPKEAPKAGPGAFLSEAILVVDMCNSTDKANLYGDSLAFKLFNELTDIVKPMCEREKFNYFKTTGDGYMVTFPTTASAKNVAVELLKKINSRNKKVDKKERIDLRFAINIGETRVDIGEDRVGAAVNMTFRVEGVQKDKMMSAPGGIKPDEMPEKNRILLTEQAYINLNSTEDINARLIGFFELKGFNGLHRIYQLLLSKKKQE